MEQSQKIASTSNKRSALGSTVHCHTNQEMFSKRTKNAKKKLIISSILCLFFMISEIVGGVLSNSLAIATDAAHLLTDLAAFMISLFSIWLGEKPPNQTLLFGWHRAEVIGALVSVLSIWLITGILFYMAVLRMLEMSFEIDCTVMLITSGVAIVFNVIMGTVLHQSPLKHNHGTVQTEQLESSVTSVRTDAIEGNINVRAALIHVIGDTILSFGIFVAAIIIYFKEDWKIVDPICTILFSILVLITTYHILKDILIVLMEGSPKGTDISKVINHLTGIEGVVAIHNIRIWALSLEKRALSVHLVIDPKKNPNVILSGANEIINKKLLSMSILSKWNHSQGHCRTVFNAGDVSWQVRLTRVDPRIPLSDIIYSFRTNFVTSYIAPQIILDEDSFHL